jgi:hypothetical protein
VRDFSRSVEIAAPVDVVWSVLSDGQRWPEWTPTVSSVKPLKPGPLAVGSMVLIRQPKFPPAVWEVVELDPGRSFTWVTRSPGVAVVARHQVEPLGSGTRATLSLRFNGLLGGLVGALTRRLNEKYLSLEAAGLRARSESRRAGAALKPTPDGIS